MSQVPTQVSIQVPTPGPTPVPAPAVSSIEALAADPAASAAVEADRDADPERPLASVVRDLELENARLRRIVADQALEIEAMRELARGTY